MYNNYIWNFAPHFTQASAFLAPNVPIDTGTWRLKAAFHLWQNWRAIDPIKTNFTYNTYILPRTLQPKTPTTLGMQKGTVTKAFFYVEKEKFTMR